MSTICKNHMIFVEKAEKASELDMILSHQTEENHRPIKE